MTVEIKFSRQIFDFLYNKLETAEESILICMAWFTDPELVKLLCNKKTHHVEIKCLIHNSSINKKCPDLTKLESVIRIIKDFRTKPLMHNKYCIIDNKLVITGSYNWTVNARINNYENIICLEDDNVVKAFNADFRKIFSNDLSDEFKTEKLIDTKYDDIENIPLLKLELDYNNDIMNRIESVKHMKSNIDIDTIFQRITSRTAVFVAKELATAYDGETIQSGLEKLKNIGKLEYSLEESIILKKYSELFDFYTKDAAWKKLTKLGFFNYPIYLNNKGKYIDKPQKKQTKSIT